MKGEGKGRLAKREGVEVTSDDGCQRFQRVGDGRVEADRKGVGVRIERDERVISPGRAARILGECHGAMPGGEFDGKIMLPMLAQLLEIFASVRGRNLGDRTDRKSTRLNSSH